MKRATALTVAAVVIGAGSVVAAAPAEAAKKPAATVTSMSAHSGGLAGGQNVTVRGKHLKKTRRVDVGGTKATFQVVSDSSVKVRIPKSSKAVSTYVRLATAKNGRTKATSAAGWTYVAAPAVTRLSVTAGPLAGGTRLTVNGRNLKGARTVTFGASKARIVKASTATAVVVDAPKHAAGVVDVKVANAYGTSRAGIRYTYAKAPTVSSLPTFVSEDGASFTVDGANLSTLRGVTVGGHTAKASGTSGILTIAAPAHAPGLVPIVITTAGGHTTTQLLYESKTPATVTSGTTIDTVSGRIVDLSCPSTEFCAAITEQSSTTFDGTDWSAPKQIPIGSLSHVSCSSATFCLAVNAQSAAVFDGSSWTTTNPGVTGLRSVSCPVNAITPDAQQCVVDGSSRTAVLDSGHWTSVASAPGANAAAMSCVSPTFCMAVDSTKQYTFNGSTWTPRTVAAADGTTPTSLSDVSCRSTTDCTAVAGHADRWSWQNNVWTVSPGNHTGFDRPRISCIAGSDKCVLSDGISTVIGFRSNGAEATTTFRQVGDAGSESLPVSCATPEFCVAMSSLGDMAYWDANVWTNRTGVVQPLTSLACVRSDLCFAADRSGSVSRYDGSSWGQPVSVDSAPSPTLVSCTSDTLCATAGQSTGTAAVSTNGGTWTQTANVLADAVAISCGGERCLAVSATQYATYTKSSSAWTPAANLPASGATSVSCATTSDCVATFDSGYATFDGSAWTKVVPISSRMTTGRVACSSDGSCIARNAGLTSQRTPAGVWDQPVRTATYAVGGDLAVMCGGGTCLSLNDSAVQFYRAGVWHLVQSLQSGTSQTRQAACGSDGACLVVDQAGNVAKVAPPGS